MVIAKVSEAIPRDVVSNAPVMLVSMDAHVSPSVEVFRDYCESKYLDDYDAFVKAFSRLVPPGFDADRDTERRLRYLAKVEEFSSDDLNGGDGAQRLKNMDADGVAAEFVFHGGFNLQPIPFFSKNLSDSFSQDIPETTSGKEFHAAEIRMYNRWLADWVSAAPDRLLGLAHIPAWDIESTLTEVKAAYKSGLSGSISLRLVASFLRSITRCGIHCGTSAQNIILDFIRMLVAGICSWLMVPPILRFA